MPTPTPWGSAVPLQRWGRLVRTIRRPRGRSAKSPWNSRRHRAVPCRTVAVYHAVKRGGRPGLQGFNEDQALPNDFWCATGQ